MDIEITGGMDPVEIGATGVAEIVQNVKTILSTVKGTVPLDRAFGIEPDFVDEPTPAARSLIMANVVDAVNEYEPRVAVTGVDFNTDQAMDGILVPVVQIKIKDGVI